MSVPTAAPAEPTPGVRQYSLLCLAAVAVLFAVLMLVLPPLARVFGLLPVVIGLVGVGLRWRLAPVALVLSVAALLTVTADLGTSPGWPTASSSPATDLLLSAAVLAYVAGHYRLQALTQFLFPRDLRRAAGAGAAAPAGGRPSSALPPQRSPALASAEELIQLLLAVPACLLLALLVQRYMITAGPPPELVGESGKVVPEGPAEAALLTLQVVAEALWRARFLLWTLGAGTLVVSGLLGYLAWQRRGRAEAVLFLQDVAWADSRAEQRRIHSWLVGARRRRERKKESS